MVIRRRRRAIPAELAPLAPAGAVRIEETWPNGARPGTVDPDRVEWLDADDQPVPLRSRYVQVALPPSRRDVAPQGAVTAVERYVAYDGEPWPAAPTSVTWLDAQGQELS